MVKMVMNFVLRMRSVDVKSIPEGCMFHISISTTH